MLYGKRFESFSSLSLDEVIAASEEGDGALVDAFDGNYTVKIVRNEDYQEGDTMTYTVATCLGDQVVETVSYEDVDLSDKTELTAEIAPREEESAQPGDTLSYLDEDEQPVALEPTVFESTPLVSISFDSGEGSGSMEAMEFVEGTDYLLPDCGFTPPRNMVFKAWAGLDGEALPRSSQTALSSATFTAVYEERPAGIGSLDYENMTVSAEIFCPEEVTAKAYCAFYSETGKMLHVDVEPLTAGEDTAVSFSNMNLDTAYIKLFVLDADSQPLCEAKAKSVT